MFRVEEVVMWRRGEGLALGRTVRTGPYRSVPWPYGRTDGIDHAVKKCYRGKKLLDQIMFYLDQRRHMTVDGKRRSVSTGWHRLEG